VFIAFLVEMKFQRNWKNAVEQPINQAAAGPEMSGVSA
jgi:hypothetical protein